MNLTLVFLSNLLTVGFVVSMVVLGLIGLALLLDKVRGTRWTYEKPEVHE
jgi:hypothetical protein